MDQVVAASLVMARKLIEANAAAQTASMAYLAPTAPAPLAA
jgi:hypothetical protein